MGYSGRTAVFEIVLIDAKLERMISENKLIKFENNLKVFQKINYKEEKYAVFHFNKDGILLEETPKYVK